MPDGDLLHPELHRKYQLPYRRLCEDVLRPDEQARGLVERVKGDIIVSKSTFMPILQSVTKRLNNIAIAMPNQGASIDCQQEISNMQKTVLNLSTKQGESYPRYSKRIFEIALRAAQDLLYSIERGNTPVNISFAYCLQFTQRLYQAQFSDATPRLDDHFDNVKSAMLQEKLQQIQPHIDAEFEYLANQMVQQIGEETLRLRLRPRKRQKIQDLNADIMDVFN